MGFKIKNSLTGEFEKLPILTLKGEKGETGGVEEYNKVDYMGNKYETLKQANDANVEYAVKTAIGEFNYLDYDGQHITATDTIEGRSKSAILKGQTLVNVLDINNLSKTNITIQDNIITYTGINTTENMVLKNLKPLTKYALFFNVLEESSTPNIPVRINDKGSDYEVNIYGETNPSSGFHSFTTGSDVSNIKFIFYTNGKNQGYKITVPMIIEYQEGMENWDIPYFEGMQSVKMPVLTTTGKNLFDVNGGFDHSNSLRVEGNNVVVNTNKTYQSSYIDITNLLITNRIYSVSVDMYGQGRFSIRENEYNGNAVVIFTNQSGNKTDSFNVKANTKYFLRVDNGDAVDTDVVFSNIQLEEGSIATPYEPYKSNILTTPEDLELRGIGNVKDELNISTGEKVERIGEVFLNGSESWSYNPAATNKELGISGFSLSTEATPDRKWNAPVLCDKMPVITSLGKVGVYNGQGLNILIKSDSTNVNTLKEILAKDPITVQYELQTPVIKTVDLSDNHVYSYKGTTHYDCSSAEGSLVPTLSVKVPTDVQATIAQQRETIQTLNSENERLNQIQEALKASMLDSQVQLMNLSWDTDFEVFTLRESIAPKDFLLDSRTGSNIDKFSQAKFIIENDCPDLEKLNSQIEYYFSKDVFSQEQFEELTDLISIVKGGNGCEY